MKRIKYILLIICLILITGCSIIKQNQTPTKNTKTTITFEEMKTMEKVTRVILDDERESLKISDLTDEERGKIAINLVDNYTETSGTEMTKNFQKYFGENTTVTYKDIPCFMKHDNPEEQTMLIFDKEKDKYVYNDKHPGHGGGGNVSTQTMVELESMEVEGDTYTYNAKVLFYGPFWCHDTGGCEYGKAYKTGKDLKNETNPLVDITKEYTKENYEGLPETDMDKVMEDYKEKLDTYQFIFEKTSKGLIFKEYKKA